MLMFKMLFSVSLLAFLSFTVFAVEAVVPVVEAKPDTMLIIVGVLLVVSEALASLGILKSNSITQFLLNALKAIKDAMTK